MTVERRETATSAPRARVLASARELFLERGFLATTIGAIAENAGVALRTIYSGYGSKAGILAAVQDQAVAGDADPVPMLHRPWVRELRSQSGTDALRSVVSHFAEATERAAPILEVIQAAASDHAVRDLLDRLHEQRLTTCRGIAELLVARGDDQTGGDRDQLADELYALLGTETHQLLVVRRGWTRHRWETWTTDCLTQQWPQLRPAPPPATTTPHGSAQQPSP